MKGYPRRFLPNLVACFALLATTGLLLVPTTLEFRFGWDVAWRIPGDQRLWVAALHTALALLMCAFAGALWSIHMRVGWRGRRHLRSGLATIGLLIAAGLTALGVLYAGDESWLAAASASHTVIGAVSVLCGAAHWGVALVERARRRAQTSDYRVATSASLPPLSASSTSRADGSQYRASSVRANSRMSATTRARPSVSP